MPSAFPAVSPRMPREVDAGGGVCWGAPKDDPGGGARTPSIPRGLALDPIDPERTTTMVDDQTSLYRYFDREGALIYVGVTSRGATRNVEHNTTKGWWQYVAHQQVEHFSTRAAALAAEKRAILAFGPPFNVQHNPGHATTRAAYLRYREALESGDVTRAPFSSTGRRFVWLVPISGRSLGTLPVEASRLSGGTHVQVDQHILVSTPQRTRAGNATAEMRGGLLAIHLDGKYLPDEVTHARARVRWNGNAKPPTFSVVKVLLNEALTNDLLDGVRGNE